VLRIPLFHPGGCGYCSSILEFPELNSRRELKQNVTSSLPNPLLQKLKDGRTLATAVTLHCTMTILRFSEKGQMEMIFLHGEPRYILGNGTRLIPKLL